MNPMDFFRTLIEPLQKSAKVTNVYGEPIIAEGKTVVPVAKISYGFGGGTGKKGNNTSTWEQGEQEGGGVGGGVKATPVGVVEITENDTKFIRFDGTKKAAGMIAAGLLVGMWLGRRRASKMERQEREEMKRAA